MTTTRQPVPNEQEETFRGFAIATIRARLAKMLTYADGVREGDEEALHDMRVASRRLRAALAMCASAFPDPAYYDLEDDVKAVTDSLGEARDLDVMIEALEKLEGRLPADERAGVAGLVADKQARRAKLQGRVAAALDRLARRDLSARFEQIVARCVNQARWLAEAAELADPPAVESPTANGRGEA